MGAQCRFDDTRECVIAMPVACIVIILDAICAFVLYKPMILPSGHDLGWSG